MKNWKQTKALLIGCGSGVVLELLTLTGTTEDKLKRVGWLLIAGLSAVAVKLLAKILAMLRHAPRAIMAIIEKFFPPSFETFHMQADSYRYWERSQPSPLLRCPWSGEDGEKTSKSA